MLLFVFWGQIYSAVGIRRITNAGSKKIIGKFASKKMNTAVLWESQIKRDFIYLLEIDPDVISFSSQPFRIDYTSNGCGRHYTPDFFVERRSKKQVVEIKPSKKIHTEKIREILRHIPPLCARQGWEFVLLTDEMIRVYPRLDNVKLLHKYSRIQLKPHQFLVLEAFIRKNEGATLREVEEALSSRGISRDIIFALIYQGFFETDLMAPIRNDSVLRLSESSELWEKVRAF